MAAPDKAVVSETVKQAPHNPKEIRESDEGCDSGITLSMKICGTNHWKREDMRLNQIYEQTRAKAKELGYEASLVRAQRAWLAYRDMACANEGEMSAGQGTYNELYRIGCMADLTKERADRLETRLDQYIR